jgi:hypothetical protein
MGRKTKQLDPRPCARCETPVTQLTRVRTGADPEWRLVCDGCWERVHTEAGYQYGGQWRARKRR